MRNAEINAECKVWNARDWLTSKTTWPYPFRSLPHHVLQLMAIKCRKLYTRKGYIYTFTVCVITSKDGYR